MAAINQQESAKYVDLCRLCATKTGLVIGIDIFGAESELRQIYKKIQTCLPIQILEGDELPKMICENCLYKLEMLYEFRERSLRTESLLIDLFKEISNLNIVQHMKLDAIEHSEYIDITQLTNHDMILTEQNLENLDIGNHNLGIEKDAGQSLLVHENDLNPHQIDYQHQTHPILNEEYSLNDIQLEEETSNQVDDDLINSNEIKIEETRLLIGEPPPVVTAKLDWIFCNMCGKSYEGKELFQIHYNTQCNKCEMCAAVFSNRQSLNSHRKEAHPSSSYDDEHDESSLIMDKEESDNENVDEPADDDGEAEEEDNANAVGGNKKRTRWSPKVCKECGKVYKTNYKLTEHMRKHTGEQPFKCTTCDKAFRSKIGLAQHEATHTGQYDFSCITCGKGFQCKSYLMVHQRVHSDVKPFPCTTCGRNFKTKQSLLDHTNRHLGLKPYNCDICGRSFITKGLCKAHKKVHSGTDNRKYSCKICNKMFVSKSYLQTHTRIHTGEKPFMCEVCGKAFLTRVDLKIHSTMHTGEKSYVCEMCGKAFARRDALRCHRRSHTGERPYRCDICGHTFTQFSPMVIHKRLHTGERPYECEVCGKKFVSRSTMMVHSKKHTA